MSDVLHEVQDRISLITMNRVHKHNAFDHQLLTELQEQLDLAIDNPQVRVIVLKANGKHFSAGADLAWMRSMMRCSEEENIQDALILATFMYRFYCCPKPTLAMIQGAAFGGGAGLAAVCDIAIAATSAQFCFSEVQLGLIPAVISPYVIQAIGARNAKMLFMSAERFDAARAQQLNLIQHCIPEQQLLEWTLNLASQISQHAPEALSQCKRLVSELSHKTIDPRLVHDTAKLIAQKRVSSEGQAGLRAFLNKEKPHWS